MNDDGQVPIWGAWLFILVAPLELYFAFAPVRMLPRTMREWSARPYKRFAVLFQRVAGFLFAVGAIITLISRLRP
jgi:threonine/homoserine/homoserine lactone efflux protein